MKLLVYLFTVLVSVSALAVPAVPDPEMTPGHMCGMKDPDYDHLRYAEQIPWCRRNVSHADRDHIYDMYGIPEKCRMNYTVDHFIPLSMGGNNSYENLWPEHKKIKQLRLNLENDLHQMMNEGKISQKDAIAEIIQQKLNPPEAAFHINDPCESPKQK